MPEKYHLRRKDKEIKSKKEIISILMRAEHVTLAMCKGGEPYLATVSHGLDPKRMVLCFHCAKTGKKIDFIKANPIVWGQAIEDLGYRQGECDHSYRTAQFRGKASIVKDLDEKKAFLHIMIDRLEEDPVKGKKEFIDASSLKTVCIVKVKIDCISGKESRPKKKSSKP